VEVKVGTDPWHVLLGKFMQGLGTADGLNVTEHLTGIRNLCAPQYSDCSNAQACGSQEPIIGLRYDSTSHNSFKVGLLPRITCWNGSYKQITGHLCADK
jgi:hypothetical protein